MDETTLAAIEARAAAATPEPWTLKRAEESDRQVWVSGAEVILDWGDPDAAFIAAARSDVPALVAEVRRLTAENAAWLDDKNRASAAIIERLRAERDTARAERDALIESLEGANAAGVRAHQEIVRLQRERDRLVDGIRALAASPDRVFGLNHAIGTLELIDSDRLRALLPEDPA